MAITVNGLTRSFGDRLAVDRVSFEVPDGQITGFVGGNGAGKTTTMRMVMGLLSPDSGEVTFNGRPITAKDRRQIGYLPEERGLYPKQKVADQLVYLGELGGMTPQAARQAVAAWLERFGLTDRSGDNVEKLSLGNQQRVQIIAGLMFEPAALILDEPFSGLDPNAVDSMAEVLREEITRGVPLLFSSHQLDLVERFCDRLVILRQGRVVAQGTVDELRSTATPRHRLTLGGDAGWVRDQPGVGVHDLDGNTALLTLANDAVGQHLLAEAMRRGPVLEFAPQRPSVAEIYREVSQ